MKPVASIFCNDGVARPLRFAVRSQGTTLPIWQARCIRELRSSGVAELAFLITERPIPAAESRGLWALLRRFFFRARALAPEDMRDELAGIPLLAETDAGLDFSRLDLDFVLDFGAPHSSPNLRRSSRYGVWSYGQRGGGHACGVWETYDRSAVTTATLQRETDQECCIVLRKGVFKTQPHSLDRTQNDVLLGSTEWPRQVCLDIRNGVSDYLDAGPATPPDAAWRAPNALQALALLGKLAASRITRILRALFCHPLWTLGVAEAPIDAFLNPAAQPAIQWLPEPPDGTFIADPFAIQRDGRLTILYEDFYFHDNRGRIACVPVEDGRQAGPPQTVFDLPFHMSYPYLFQHEGTIYCIPETHEAEETVLYEAVEFPTRWRKAATLLEGFPACDSTVFQHEGRWWLACTSYAADSSLKLFLWHAPALLGPWQPHAGNPVKADVTSSRPAGTPFIRDGVLYRPAQDCSVHYGGRVVINRVRRLTPTEFREEPTAVVEPDRTGPYPSGLHTIAACGDLTVVDGLRYTFRPMTFLATLRRLGRFALGRFYPPRKGQVRAKPVAGTQPATCQVS